MHGFGLVLGEALVDLIEGSDADGAPVFRPRFGGSPLNVAVGMRRLGASVEFVGAFGEDAFGRKLREFLCGEGIGVDRSVSAGMGTCLAVATAEQGHMRYEYFGDVASMLQITPVDRDFAEQASVIHAGSTVFNDDPAYSAAVELYETCPAFMAIDPNPRHFLVPDVDRYRRRLERATSLVDLIKLSGDDVGFLYPGSPIEEAAGQVRGSGTATVIVTRAQEDTFLMHGDVAEFIPVPSLVPVDPTGAGDSFMASMLSDVVRDGPPAGPADWQLLIVRATAAAAITCSAVGGAESMPTRVQLDQRLAGSVANGPASA